MRLFSSSSSSAAYLKLCFRPNRHNHVNWSLLGWLSQL